MSLRVLLADESDTIKKVFQLALQDLNAEVKSVHSGLDVMDVSKSFKPDIIFADILLQKKNGYEVCLQIKQSADLATVPVVLMWSSFMELDQAQFIKCQANDQLEKPFDADNLREIIKKQTPDLAANPMAEFLNFSKANAIPSAPLHFDTPAAPVTKNNIETSTPNVLAKPNNLSESLNDENTSEFNLAALLQDLPDENSIIIHGMTTGSGTRKSLFDDLTIQTDEPTPQESWQEQNLSQFQIPEDKSDDLDKFESLNLSVASSPNTLNEETPPPQSLSFEAPTAFNPFEVDVSATAPATVATPSEVEQPIAYEPLTSVSFSETLTPAKVPSAIASSTSEIEAIVRAHTEEILKLQLQDNLMSVIEKVVRQELNRILEEEVRLQQDSDIES